MLAVLVAGTTIAVALLIVSGERFTHRDRVIGALLAAIGYGYGAIVPLNMWLDRELPQTVRGVVLELTPEHVVIDAPAPFGVQISEEISRDLSERLTVGGPICIDLYRGAFRIRSYETRVCATIDGAVSSE
ncbi:MAG: hypothetical protein NT015_16170 [Alphaproteobacteria bacterium]|nr:hypothetical protein [Alphaproteobacteria bacterium]